MTYGLARPPGYGHVDGPESQPIAGMPLSRSIRIASYNIHKAVGTDRKRDPARIVRVISEIDADVIALQEADMRFGDRTGLLNLPALEELTGLVPLPIERHRSSHGFHGNLILARNTEAEIVHHLHLPGLEPRGALIADIAVAGHSLRVVATHLGLLAQSRLIQARAILERIHGLDHRPTVLMGDLNEWRTGTRSSLRPFESHFPASHGGRSFPARYPMLPLDRILASERTKLVDFSVHDTPLSRVASDHLPITARLHI
ncbi:endonuclease/exonuclease/phosphatase family protein [Tabrizicola sp. J26]|uniref:endonuclease/exonuclease/phosphatase family protein n=1 Tax=Alitabrizicola rongguiensis TaxID=2909234 RepID=UPI001F2F8ED2|nr:endonuclease/exonuclease/phosphatase family protein [Tabrizicola rongguiensis]MCF1710850.1 endonuclease/exonuclease/phosphatase family protein [Tabrizicola rongguiensis]